MLGDIQVLVHDLSQKSEDSLTQLFLALIEKKKKVFRTFVDKKNMKFNSYHFSRPNTSKGVFGDLFHGKIAFLEYKNIDITKLQNFHFLQRG